MSLDPQLGPLLDFLNATPRQPATLSPAALRAGYRALTAGRRGPELARVEDLHVPGSVGAIPARLYRPDAAAPLPLLVYFHGGGFVVCDLDTHDPTCRHLALRAGCAVLSVDYRLAPEAKFPAAPEDCFAATLWAAANAARLGVDAARIAVAGDSAGGNLAAVVAAMTRDRGGPRLVHQLLVYPVTDLVGFESSHASYRENAEGYFLTAAMMRWFAGHYLERTEHGRNPLASPLLAPDLSGLAPATLITAEYDPLRDEGELYGERLRSAGVPVAQRRYDGMIHGFFAMTEMLDRAREALDWAGARLRAAFDEAPRKLHVLVTDS
jgi:acetyl esterase